MVHRHSTAAVSLRDSLVLQRTLGIMVVVPEIHLLKVKPIETERC